MPYTKVLHKPLGFINLQNLCLTASAYAYNIDSEPINMNMKVLVLPCSS